MESKKKVNKFLLKLKNEKLTNEKVNSILDLIGKNFELININQNLNNEAFNSILKNLQKTHEQLVDLDESVKYNGDFVFKLNDVFVSVVDTISSMTERIDMIEERLDMIEDK